MRLEIALQCSFLGGGYEGGRDVGLRFSRAAKSLNSANNYGVDTMIARIFCTVSIVGIV